MWSLVVESPEKHRGQAVNFFPKVFENKPEKGKPGIGGRGQGIFLGPLSTAPLLYGDGPPERMAIRRDDDRDLALEVNHRKFEVGNALSFWANGFGEQCKREWALKFCLHGDGTVSPESKDLVLGVSVNEHGQSLIVLVAKDDTDRRLVFKTGKDLADCLQNIAEERAKVDLREQRVLRFTSPKCEWMGPGIKALVLRGPGYSPTEETRGHGIGIGFAKSAVFVCFDGVPADAMAIRKFDDEDLALEVNGRKNHVGVNTSMWNSGGNRANACKFTMNPDRTLSPFGAKELVIGAKQDTTELVLVKRGNPLQLVLETDEEMRTSVAAIQAEQKAAEAALAALQEEARSRCNDQLLRCLKEDGFAYIPGAVPLEVVKSAKKEINRAMGASSKSADAFKGKEFPKNPAITDLINKSMVPVILEQLLGEKNYSAGSGQIALRFPGDFCRPGTCEADFSHFEGIRRGWHIDGCPSNFIPGVTDHFGKIANFDALVGVLLSDSDIHDRMCGELCVYPGSHLELAQYFKEEGLEKVARGDSLPIGETTDKLFSRKPIHCTGKAGDVYIANYMTAHFIAPNTSPDIRYACYFRFKGPDWTDDIHQPASMLDPLLHWQLGAARAPLKPLKPTLSRMRTLEESVARQDIEDYYASSNNDYAQTVEG